MQNTYSMTNDIPYMINQTKLNDFMEQKYF